MSVAAYALLLTLSQEPEPAPSAPEAPPVAAPGPVAAPTARPTGADEVTRAVQKLGALAPQERAAALRELYARYGQADANPVLPSPDFDPERYLALPPAAQAQLVARAFFVDLIAGDPARLVARSGLPFHLEGRRVERADELRAEWGKALRSRRTDLLALYDVEVLTPAEMEKKYGKAPQRLSAWGWRGPNVLLAIGNLSGHATILLLRQVGAAWQVVAFHD